ncbi:MAG: preprotein translocase subunit SecY [Candidatus Aenigmarchaeota archaeon]|nr:preprotein translocase subunit SecY [Candidatus Aenigmarchaeota archaeon]
MNFEIWKLAEKLPSIERPIGKISLKEKAKWTVLILSLYFLMGSLIIWGIDKGAVSHFQFLEVVFGSAMGSLITLGIGPIVTASIILQLLVGSKLINWNLQDAADKAKFMGTQKILAILFCFIEGIAYVVGGAVPPAGGGALMALAIIFQLALGGIIIMYLDELSTKWGIGSGISLFIAAGVSKRIIIRIFSLPIKDSSGGIVATFISLLGQGNPIQATLSLLPLVSLIVVLLIVTFAQNLRVEIPLSFVLPFGKFASRRWPLKFIYTSNIPVILAAAVIANLQVFGRIMYSKGISLFGTYDLSTGRPTGGLMFYLTSPQNYSLIVIVVLGALIALLFAFLAIKTWRKNAFRFSVIGFIIGSIIGYLIVISLSSLPELLLSDVIRSITYMLAMIIGAIIFSKFWVMTSGMDAKSVASQFQSSAISIPGFRRDPRIIEKVLQRYIPALTVMGGAFVGFLAGFADLSSAIGSGTGILLTVMIIQQMYDQIYQNHADEIPESIKKIMGD